MNTKVGIVGGLAFFSVVSLDSVLVNSLGVHTNWMVHVLYGLTGGLLIHLAHRIKKSQDAIITLLSVCLCGLVLWRWM